MNYYNRLVKEHGEEYARNYMRSVRAKVKKPGLANVDKERRVEIAKAAAAARWKKDAPPQETTP